MGTATAAPTSASATTPTSVTRRRSRGGGTARATLAWLSVSGANATATGGASDYFYIALETTCGDRATERACRFGAPGRLTVRGLDPGTRLTGTFTFGIDETSGGFGNPAPKRRPGATPD